MLSRLRLVFVVLLFFVLAVPVQAQLGRTELPSVTYRIVEFRHAGYVYYVNVDSTQVFYDDPLLSPQIALRPPENREIATVMYEHFLAKTPFDGRKETAERLIHAIDVTLSKIGGLGLREDTAFVLLQSTVSQLELDARLPDFPLFDLLKAVSNDDPARYVSVLRETKKGLQRVR